MNTGVEILLRRMETHPEEFTPAIEHGRGKWASLVDAYKDHIDAEDYEALKLGIKKILQDKFTERVMQMLAGVDETSEQGKSLTSNTGMGGATLGTWGNGLTTNALYQTTQAIQATQATLTLGDTTLSEAGLKQMLATHKAIREETKPKRWWNKSIPELLGKK